MPQVQPNPSPQSSQQISLQFSPLRKWTRGTLLFIALLSAASLSLAQQSPDAPSPVAPTTPAAQAPPASAQQSPSPGSDANPAQQASAKQPPSSDQPPAQKASQDQSSSSSAETKKNDRMFFVMPNYLTVDNQSKVPPISWKEKFAITASGAFDPYEFFIVGVVAGIRQADNAYPAFGQGIEGYSKRYGTAFADQVDGNIMVGAVYPSLLKTDPRYFRLGRGGFAHRFGYGISRIFVTRKDSGGSIFNIPEFAGNATAIAISTAYYPAADRSFSSSFNNYGLQLGLDAFGNELKEFWPDIHQYFRKKKHPS